MKQPPSVTAGVLLILALVALPFIHFELFSARWEVLQNGRHETYTTGGLVHCLWTVDPEANQDRVGSTLTCRPAAQEDDR